MCEAPIRAALAEIGAIWTMDEEIEELAPELPEVVVRVQTISDSKALTGHFERMFEQGQPHYRDAYDPDGEPWILFPDMVEGHVDVWQPIEGPTGRERSVIAVAITLSMPTGTDPLINGAAALALARREFADREHVWVSGDHEGPFVKFLVQYRDEDDRPLKSGPSDLRRYREVYAQELCIRGVQAHATTRGARGLGFGEKRQAYKARRRSRDCSEDS